MSNIVYGNLNSKTACPEGYAPAYVVYYGGDLQACIDEYNAQLPGGDPTLMCNNCEPLT